MDRNGSFQFTSKGEKGVRGEFSYLKIGVIIKTTIIVALKLLLVCSISLKLFFGGWFAL